MRMNYILYRVLIWVGEWKAEEACDVIELGRAVLEIIDKLLHIH